MVIPDTRGFDRAGRRSSLQPAGSGRGPFHGVRPDRRARPGRKYGPAAGTASGVARVVSYTLSLDPSRRRNPVAESIPQPESVAIAQPARPAIAQPFAVAQAVAEPEAQPAIADAEPHPSPTTSRGPNRTPTPSPSPPNTDPEPDPAPSAEPQPQPVPEPFSEPGDRRQLPVRGRGNRTQPDRVDRARGRSRSVPARRPAATTLDRDGPGRRPRGNRPRRGRRWTFMSETPGQPLQHPVSLGRSRVLDAGDTEHPIGFARRSPRTIAGRQLHSSSWPCGGARTAARPKRRLPAVGPVPGPR